jgi:cytochrome c oxidase assembly protein Cox11
VLLHNLDNVWDEQSRAWRTQKGGGKLTVITLSSSKADRERRIRVMCDAKMKLKLPWRLKLRGCRVQMDRRGSGVEARACQQTENGIDKE